MRRLFALFLFVSAAPSAQPVASSDGVYASADVAPAPVGGLEALASRAVYPPDAGDAAGLVLVTFVVGPDGTVSGARALRAPHPALGAAAVAAVEASTFTPGRVGDRAVPTRLTLPIQFAPPADAYADQRAAPVGGWERFLEAVVWPQNARDLGLEGAVTLEVAVDEQGAVTDAAVLDVEGADVRVSQQRVAVRSDGSLDTPRPRSVPRSGHSAPQFAEALTRAVLAAVASTRFTPEIRDGEAVAGTARVRLPFDLSR